MGALGAIVPWCHCGAIKGRAPLTLSELEKLDALCRDLSRMVAEEAWDLRVNALAQTVFAWPSHERLISRFEVKLVGEPDLAEPDQAAMSYVDEVWPHCGTKEL